VYRTVLGAMIGGCVGLYFRSPWTVVLLGGALAWVGSRLDVLSEPIDVDAPDFGRPRRPPAGEREAGPARRALESHVAALFAALTQAGGQVLPRQVRLIRHFFAHDLGYSEDGLQSVREALKEALAAPLPLEEAAAHCVEALGETERLLLFDSLVDVALSDGHLSPAERELLERLAPLLALDPRDVANVFLVNEGDPLEKAYRLLGVAPGTPTAEVKRAWRRLAALHHPDKVAHLGAAAVAAAEARFRELQAAWDEVQRSRAA
jgi:DnaJ like chaperone protein